MRKRVLSWVICFVLGLSLYLAWSAYKLDKFSEKEEDFIGELDTHNIAGLSIKIHKVWYTDSYQAKCGGIPPTLKAFPPETTKIAVVSMTIINPTKIHIKLPSFLPSWEKEEGIFMGNWVLGCMDFPVWETELCVPPGKTIRGYYAFEMPKEKEFLGIILLDTKDKQEIFLNI